MSVKENWVKMYITRWLTAPIEDKRGNRRLREGKGTPQGGVISPLLANLFLHYSFDRWLEITYPNLRFVRYADDIIVHCNSQAEAEDVLKAINKRLGDCSLQLNEKKTKIVYCKKTHRKDKFKTVQFTFLDSVSNQDLHRTTVKCLQVLIVLLVVKVKRRLWMYSGNLNFIAGQIVTSPGLPKNLILGYGDGLIITESSESIN